MSNNVFCFHVTFTVMFFSLFIFQTWEGKQKVLEDELIIMEDSGQHDVEDVTSTLQSFHIGENRANINRTAPENVFQRTHRRLQPQEGAGLLSSEYSSDDSASSNEKRSFKQRIQRKLNQKPQTSLKKDDESQSLPKDQVPDVVPRTDPCNTHLSPFGVVSNVNGHGLEAQKRSNDNITGSDDPSTLNFESTSQSSNSQNTSEPKAPERRRRRFITRDPETSGASAEIPASTETSKTQSRRSVLNQADTNSQSSMTRTRRSMHTESPFTGLRAKSVERTLRERSSPGGESELSKSLIMSSPTNSGGDNTPSPTQRSSSSRSAAECIRLRRVQSLERGQRPKLSRNVNNNNKSCDDKQLSLPTTEVTQTPVIGSPLIAKLESTYKLLRSRSVRLASDASTKDDESTALTKQNTNNSSPQNNTDVSQTTVSDGSKSQDQANNQQHVSTKSEIGKDVEEKDITLIFKSDETMNRPVDPNIHYPEIKSSKLDPSIYPDISENNISMLGRAQNCPSDVSSRDINKEKSTTHKLSRSPVSKSMSETSNISSDIGSTPKSSRSMDLPDTALKRTPLVTDLDQAMKQRDEEKLRQLFRNSESEINADKCHKKQDQQARTKQQSSSDMETDLDNISVPSTRTVTSNMSSSAKVTSEMSKVQNSHNDFSKEMSTKKSALDSPKPYSSSQEIPTNSYAGTQKEVKNPKTEPCEDATSKEYSPYMNLEDSVKWPASVPGKLDFSHMEVFEG